MGTSKIILDFYPDMGRIGKVGREVVKKLDYQVWKGKMKGHARDNQAETDLIITNIDGAPTASKSHTHPSHSQTSRLLTSSLSLGVPVPRVTQCIRGV